MTDDGNAETSLAHSQPRWLRLVTSPQMRLGLLVAILAAGVVATVALAPGGATERRELLETVQGAVSAAGPAAPIAYVVLYAVGTVVFVPGAPLSVAGGALFGPLWGTVLIVAGATLGAGGAFVVARRLGRDQIEALAAGRLGQVDRWLEQQGFLAVLYLRLVIIVPFNLLNYVVGITSVRRRDYLLATIIGIVPAAFAFAAFGDVALAALDGDLDALLSARFLSAVALIVLLAAGGPVVHRRLRARGLVPSAGSADHDRETAGSDEAAGHDPRSSDADE